MRFLLNTKMNYQNKILNKRLIKKLAQLQHIIDVVTVPNTPPQSSKQIQTLSQLSDTEVEQIIDTFIEEPQINTTKWNNKTFHTNITKKILSSTLFPQ